MVLYLRFSGSTYPLQPQQLQSFFQDKGTHANSYTFLHQGKIITQLQNIPENSFIEVLIPLKGGKGGYGAKLKTEGGKKVRPNDNMFSRDNQGRKIAYAAMQRQYRQFYTQRQEEDEKVKKQLAEYKVMENTLKEEHAFMKLDKTYNSKLQETEKQLNASLKVGIDKFFQKRKKETKKEETPPQEDKQEEKEKQQEKKQEKEPEKKQNKNLVLAKDMLKNLFKK